MEDLKREYLKHLDKPGYPNILFQQKDIPFVPLAKEDWELIYIKEAKYQFSDLYPSGKWSNSWVLQRVIQGRGEGDFRF